MGIQYVHGLIVKVFYKFMQCFTLALVKFRFFNFKLLYMQKSIRLSLTNWLRKFYSWRWCKKLIVIFWIFRTCDVCGAMGVVVEVFFVLLL